MTTMIIGPAVGPPDKARMLPGCIESPRQTATATTGPRILLVEDAFEMRSLLASVLRKNGYDVTEAADGADGVSKIMESWKIGGVKEPFDLVISDVRMPGWTGLEILEMVGATWPRTPVILITAFGTAETHAEGRRLGAVAVLDKPFEMSHLLGVVREIVPG